MKKLKLSELNRINVKEFKDSLKTPVTIVLDNIRSLHNIGSVFRTADAFRIEAIYLCGITGTPPNKEIHKTALGSTESVNWKYFEKTIEALNILKENKYTLFAVEQAESSNMLDEFELPPNNKIAIIFGNEINGIDELLMDEVDGCIEIPQYGTKHSLNISVSVGIVVWEIFQKIKVNKKTR
ncbi:MAG: RNA methyltransferase [Bacteroidetes bacterium]|nr:RNA methyltransferase [Bacteroidota bacterium]